MKTEIKSSDADFDKFAVTVRGDIQRRDLVVSASVIENKLVRRKVNPDNSPSDQTEEIVGEVAIIERSDAVRQKEPPVFAKAEDTEATGDAQEEAPAGGANRGGIKIKPKAE